MLNVLLLADKESIRLSVLTKRDAYEDQIRVLYFLRPKIYLLPSGFIELDCQPVIGATWPGFAAGRFDLDRDGVQAIIADDQVVFRYISSEGRGRKTSSAQFCAGEKFTDLARQFV